jgi:hypothetical protein
MRGVDRGTADTVNVGTFAYGLAISGGDGFTTDVSHDWVSTSSAPTTYICGYGDPTTASVLWNTLH